MKSEIIKAFGNRRSYYALTKDASMDDEQVEEIVKFALSNVPSAFNSQTTRIVLLFGDQHSKLWDIVKNTIKSMISAEAFAKTENKINVSFASGRGTVLFFEDDAVVGDLQKQFPSYKDNFPKWSEHTSAMHQYFVWTILEDGGLGASLQHYNPIIDEEVKKTWSLPASWRLLAQMPFGGFTDRPEAKEKLPISQTLKVFK